MTLQELEQLKLKTLTEHCLDDRKKLPRVTVGMGTCGIRAGAGEVLTELQKELNLAGEAVVTHVGCIGLCSYEPVIQVVMPGQPSVTYLRMTAEKARVVAEEHVRGGRPVSEWILPVISDR